MPHTSPPSHTEAQEDVPYTAGLNQQPDDCSPAPNSFSPFADLSVGILGMLVHMEEADPESHSGPDSRTYTKESLLEGPVSSTKTVLSMATMLDILYFSQSHMHCKVV